MLQNLIKIQNSKNKYSTKIHANIKFKLNLGWLKYVDIKK